MKSSYSLSHFTMLQSSGVITYNVGEFLTDFTERNGTINSESVNVLKNRIEDAYQNLGTDKYRNQKQSTQTISSLIEDAFEKISAFSAALKYGLRKNPDKFNFLLSSLGILKVRKGANKTTKSQIVEALNSFAQNIENYRSDITATGISTTKIDELVQLATDLSAAQQNQGVSKTRTLTVSEEFQTELNDIYEEVNALCQLGRSIFRREPNKAKMFSFTATASRLAQTRKTSSPASTTSN